MRFKEQTKDVNEASRLLEEEKIKKQQWAEWFGTKIPEIEKIKIKEWREKFGFYSKDDQKWAEKEKRKEREAWFGGMSKDEDEKIKARKERFNMEVSKWEKTE